MRLTLRTLLAYLDDVLDPADKEELGKKIESSDFAGDLILRMRDTMRRLRLSAPQVVGSGMGLDPNTVAEYLDNALPPDQVGDFERICLESDMHLAEVASCHHVLTMVLGAPAEVDPTTKARMYSIPYETRDGRHLRIEPAHAATTVATVQPASAAVPSILATAPGGAVSASTIQARPEVPEYLRAGGWSGTRAVLIAIAALVLIGATILLATGLGEWFGGTETAPVPSTASNASAEAVGVMDQEDAAGLNARKSAETEEVADQPVSAAAGDTSVAVEDNAADEEVSAMTLGSPPAPFTPGITTSAGEPPVAAGDPYAVAVDSVTAGVSGAATMEPGSEAAEAPATPADPFTQATLPTGTDPFVPPGTAATVDGSAATESSAVETAEPIDAPPSAAVVGERYANLPAESPDALATSSGDSDAATSVPPTVTPLPDESAAPMETSGGGSRETADVGSVVDGGVVDAPATADDSTEERVPELGTYLGGKTVLLRWDDKEGAWFRMPPRSAVLAGDQLLALPEFRPKLTLASGVHLDMSGGTRIALGTAEEANGDATDAADPTIDLRYGRVVLLNTANGSNPVRLNFGSTGADLELERNATLGVEVTREFVRGADPQKSASPIVVSLVAPNGGVIWRDAAGEKAIDQPSRWTITGDKMSEIENDPKLPDWIDHEPVVNRSEQVYGAPVVEETLTTDRPADNQLLELFLDGERKRKEVKSLAARSSMHVGLFVPFVEALRDSGQRPNWEKHIETLRSAMARDPQAAENIRNTLVDKRGEAAAGDLYEMLCGYSEEQVGRTPEQIRSGAIADLIDRLESDSLDYRVLAVHNLAQITGKRLMPNPAAGLTERARGVRQWRLRLGNDELGPRER